MGRIFEAQIQGFRQCTVNWEAPAAPIVDISSFERQPETGYVNDTNDDETDANTDTKADQSNTYPDTNAVKITQQTYTDDNSKLVTSEDTDTYVEDTSADIVKDNVDTSAPY